MASATIFEQLLFTIRYIISEQVVMELLHKCKVIKNRVHI